MLSFFNDGRDWWNSNRGNEGWSFTEPNKYRICFDGGQQLTLKISTNFRTKFSVGFTLRF